MMRAFHADSTPAPSRKYTASSARLGGRELAEAAAVAAVASAVGAGAALGSAAACVPLAAAAAAAAAARAVELLPVAWVPGTLSPWRAGVQEEQAGRGLMVQRGWRGPFWCN